MGNYADRIAMCQAEDGPHEHVPLKPGEDPGSCFFDCDCTLRIYVALDSVVAALAALPTSPTQLAGSYVEAADFIRREFGGEGRGSRR